MSVTVSLPDQIEARLKTKWGADLPHKMLEALAIEGYRCGDLSLGEVAEILDLSINEADGFLKKRGMLTLKDLSEIDEDAVTLEEMLNQ